VTNDHLKTDFNMLLAQTLDLLTPGKTSRSKNAKLIISCRCEEPASGSTLSTVPAGQLAIPSTNFPVASSSTNPPTIDPKQNLDLLEQFVLKEKESVHMSTPPGIGTAGIMMDAVSSDNFGTVMGFLERFVEIGDAISEVSFCIASDFYFRVEMLAGAPIRKARMGRADRCTKGSYCPPRQQ
jgi:hypothetical protein